MLLLVLIIVLVAFGLLVVALLTGNVLIAWVSVGMSVIAAVVLLIDWMQRRSAVKAGASPDVVTGPPTGGYQRLPDYEPVTEVLPVIPAAGQRPGGSPVDGGADQATSVVDARFDQSTAAEQTVVMPVIQPSGSTARPSGAEASVTSSSGISSPSVTNFGDDRSGSGPVPSEPPPYAPPPVDAPAKAKSADDEEDERTLLGVPKEIAARMEKAEQANAESATLFTAVTPGSVPAETPPPAKTPEAAPVAEAPADDPAAAEAPAAVDPDATLVNSSGNGNGNGGGNGGGIEQAAPEQAAPEQAAPEQNADETLADVPPFDGEAPEESADPVEAALVATLDDEVVVVDEQPRYHVSGCRALVSVQVIPLPVREAVDLGFTPCGWCNANHTLASRHQHASS